MQGVRPFDTQGDNPAHRGLQRRKFRIRQLLLLAVCVFGVPPALILVLARSGVVVMSEIGGAVFIIGASTIVVVGLAAVAIYDFRDMSRRIAGMARIRIDGQGIVIEDGGARGGHAGPRRIQWTDIQGIEILGANDFQLIVDLVLQLKDGQHVSLGTRPGEAGADLARALTGAAPTICAFRDYTSNTPRGNPWADPLRNKGR